MARRVQDNASAHYSLTVSRYQLAQSSRTALDPSLRPSSTMLRDSPSAPADQAQLAEPTPQPEDRVCHRRGVDPEDDLVPVFGRSLAGDGDCQARGGETLSEQVGTGDRLL